MAEHAPDNELIDRARAGDDAAFEALVRRHEPVVARTVIGMLGPGDDAEDVGQETFVRFYRSLDRFRGDATVGTYLVRIAMNLSLNALKRRKREGSRFVRADMPGANPSLRPDVAAEARERVEAVHRALAELDGRHRAVVVLRMMEGHSTRETAEMLEIPEGTVMSRLKRALVKLDRKLRPLVADEEMPTGTMGGDPGGQS
jgi:RNA polymerase sigma-70 factor, ECF subfamily